MGFEGEVSSTVIQDTPPQSNQQQSYSEDSSPMMSSMADTMSSEHQSSTSSSNNFGIYTSAGASQPTNNATMSVHQNHLVNPVTTQENNPMMQQVQVPVTSTTATFTQNPITSVPCPKPMELANGGKPTVIMNATAPIVPTLGRPPSIKINQQPELGVPPSILNARAPGSTVPVRMKVAGGGIVVQGGLPQRSGSSRGRGATSNKPPPGAVNLERSYQICQAVIQNSPNRHQLRCQLRPPPTGGGKEIPTSATVTMAPNHAADPQIPMVVRLAGASTVQKQRQPSPVLMRQVLMQSGVNNGGAGITESSMNSSRASSAPPGQQFQPVSDRNGFFG